MSRYVFLCCFLAGFLAIFGARAGEPWRVLDNTNEGSTSDCIGDPKTPLCAVETMEACIKRGEWELCQRVGYTWEELGRWIPTDYARLYYHRYRVISRNIIRRHDIPPTPKLLKGIRVRAGDLAFRLKWQGCRPEAQCVMDTINSLSKSYGEGCRGFGQCTTANGFTTYILRHHINGREVLREYYDPIFHGDFWNRK